MKELFKTIIIMALGFISATIIWECLKEYSLITCIVLIVLLVLLVKSSSKIDTIYFTKLKQGAKIPTKRDEDMGYDIYPCFDEDFVTIMPHETKMIPTGIGSAFHKSWGIILKERGSTGSKGIAQRCGVIDSGYRGEWLVPITNTTEKKLVISKDATITEENDNTIIYPYSKAICQAVVLPSPDMYVKEITNDKFNSFDSKRGIGKLGSSGK